MQTQSPQYEVTWLIRRLFRAMAQFADRYLRAYGLSAADRAVLDPVGQHDHPGAGPEGGQATVYGLTQRLEQVEDPGEVAVALGDPGRVLQDPPDVPRELHVGTRTARPAPSRPARRS